MNAQNQKPADRWQSLALTEQTFGYAVSESADQFVMEALTERVARWVGIAFVVVGYLQLLLPAAGLGDTAFMAKALMLTVMSAMGLGLYTFASRGFRREIRIDTNRGMLMLARQNDAGQVRIARHVPFAEVESVFLRRSQGPDPRAELFLRVKGMPPVIAALRGRQSEIEALHGRLCHDVTYAATAHKRTARPRLFGQRSGAFATA